MSHPACRAAAHPGSASPDYRYCHVRKMPANAGFSVAGARFELRRRSPKWKLLCQCPEQRGEGQVNKLELEAESDREPRLLRVVETIRVVESEELRERQLAAIVRLLRRAYEVRKSGEDGSPRS